MSITLTPIFLTSAHRANQFPEDVGREVAFAGRSNSGKSTAINAVVGRRKLAKTSKTPGRTQLINFFAVADECRLVDLPGYGYAKVADSVRRHWRTLMEAYFSTRRSLVGLIITVDIRRGLNDLDQVMLSWAAGTGVPATVLLTKADKLSRNAAQRRREEIAVTVPAGVALIVFSAPKRQGVDAVRACVVGWLTPESP
jgi:GTP-binding protein